MFATLRPDHDDGRGASLYDESFSGSMSVLTSHDPLSASSALLIVTRFHGRTLAPCLTSTVSCASAAFFRSSRLERELKSSTASSRPAPMYGSTPSRRAVHVGSPVASSFHAHHGVPT